MINNINSYFHISAAGTNQIVPVTAGTAGRCTLVAVVVNSTSTGTITLVDNTTGGTPVIGILKASVAEGTYLYNITVSTGLRVGTTGASDITVVYRLQ